MTSLKQRRQITCWVGEDCSSHVYQLQCWQTAQFLALVRHHLVTKGPLIISSLEFYENRHWKAEVAAQLFLGSGKAHCAETKCGFSLQYKQPRTQTKGTSIASPFQRVLLPVFTYALHSHTLFIFLEKAQAISMHNRLVFDINAQDCFYLMDANENGTLQKAALIECSDCALPQIL